MKITSLFLLVAVFAGIGSAAYGNSPATVTHSAPSTVYVGETFTVSASCYDPDGNLDGMCVRWQGYGMQAYWPESGYSGSESVTLTAPSTPCTMNIRADAIDSLGEGSASEWQIVQVIDHPNTPASVSHSAPSTVYVGETFTVTANCSDPDGNLSGMCVRWQGFGMQQYWPESGYSGNESMTLTAPSTPGTMTIRADAIDLLGEGGDSGWQTIEVIDYPANNPPTISLSFSSATAPIYGNFSVTATATDPDGSLPEFDLDVMGIRWQDHGLAGFWSGLSGGSATRSTSSLTAPAVPGTQYFRGEVWDDADAGIAADWQNIVVIDASNPSLAVLPISPKVGDTITVNYAGAPDSATWIKLFLVGSGNSSYLASVQVPHLGAGTVTFTITGNFQVGQAYKYEARMFPYDGNTESATSNEFDIAPAIPTYSVTVQGGTGSAANLHTGDVITINATPAGGQSFIRWSMYGSGNGLIGNALSTSTTFTVGTTNAIVQALYDAPPSLFVLTVDGGTSLPAGPQPAGTQITITATPPSGRSFINWTHVSGLGTLASASDSPTVFTLGAGDAAVQANLSPPPPPVITSALTASGAMGMSFSYHIAATNSPTSYSASGLPTGLVINPTSGIISGAPTQSGSFSVTIGASNSTGPGSSLLILTIGSSNQTTVSWGSGYPVVVPAGATWLEIWTHTECSGDDCTDPGITVSGPNSGMWSDDDSYPEDGSGPDGDENCARGYNSFIHLSSPAAGTYSVSFWRQSENIYYRYSATASPPTPVINSLSSATGNVGAQFLYAITATNTATGYSASPLPAGLSVNSSTGIISGTPTAVGTTTVQLHATNASGTGNAVLTITVLPAKPVISPPSPLSALAGSAFSYTILASNSPTSFTATGLPAGLTLSASAGTITGTPTASGLFNVVLTATNAGGTSAPATLVLTINAPPVIVTQPVNVNGVSGQTVIFSVTATGNALVYHWRKNGVNLTNSNIIGGVGTPNLNLVNVQATDSGAYSVVISNSAGSVTSASATLTVTATPNDPTNQNALNIHIPLSP